jgi:hypothetical protein
MKISIVVPDSTVYIGEASTQIDMPEIPANIRAVQWNERGDNTGHIELLDGTNTSITAEEFAVYDPLVARAQAKIDQAIPPVTPNGFVTTYLSTGSFDVYRVFAEHAGAVNVAGDHLDIHRASESRRVSMMTHGARLYESIAGAFEPVTLRVGDFNLDLPDMHADDIYKVTALEDGTEYYCVSRRDLQPYHYTRFGLEPGESVDLPAGKQAFIGGGATNLGVGPKLVAVEYEARTITAVSGSVFGIVF